MFRKLLACLALLTGLAAAGAPAQAEMAHALASHLEVSANVSPVASPAGAEARGVVAPRYEVAKLLQAARLHNYRSPLPGVRLSSDRARE